MWTFAVAVVPAIVLIVYIMIRDKYEREPIRKILLTFFAGMLAIPLDLLIIGIFGLDELPYLFDGDILQQIGTAFFSAAIPEEISKFINQVLFVVKLILLHYLFFLVPLIYVSMYLHVIFQK